MCDNTRAKQDLENMTIEDKRNFPKKYLEAPDKINKKEAIRELEIEIKSDSNEDKRADEILLEGNTDSNKSNNHFACPSVPSSSQSQKDVDYMTPKSMHNLNLLFTESNGKKSQTQRRIINNLNYESPLNNGVYVNYPYNFAVSPIDPSKLTNQMNIPNFTTKTNQPMIFNNNEGVMSINIKHKHVYDHRIFGKLEKMEAQNKKFNRRIEFDDVNKNEKINSYNMSNINEDKMNKESEISNEDSSIIDSSSSEYEVNENVIKKPQPILPSNRSVINNDPPVYISSFQTYNRNNHSLTQMRTLSKMTAEEYQVKSKVELDKKKNFCNCKRSKCLKLYCECFANGEMCVNCNCQDCANIIGNEEEKDETFKTIKDKNPIAMKLNNIKEQVKEDLTGNEAKIGCNCTKSNCSKKYCECYKAGVECTESCRCRDCSNASENCKENKRKMKLNKMNTINEDVSGYEDSKNFKVEKIRVLIEKQIIYIEESEIEDADNFSSNKNNINLDNNNEVNFVNKNCNVINRNNSYFIEIQKSLINFPLSNTFHLNPHSLTPIVNKFKKRRRNKSSDSNNSIEKSDYTYKLTKTACETSHKKNNFKQDLNSNFAKIISKKLNMNEIDK